MQPTIPFFVILNTPLELLAVRGAVFSNWHNNARRRLILIAGVLVAAVLLAFTAAAFLPDRAEVVTSRRRS